jgi:hypothetical protein
MAGIRNIARVVTNPTGRGGFRKGESGNPGGRAPSAVRVFSNLAVESRKYGKMALSTLVQLCKKDNPPNVRLSAAVAILDRGFGRPTQSIDLSVDTNASQLDLFAVLGVEGQQLLQQGLEAIERDPAGVRQVLDLVAERMPETDSVDVGETDDD